MPKEEKRPVGRPPKFSDPEALDKLVDGYIEASKAEGVPLTITGLALYLGFCDKCSIYEYQEKAAFTHSIKRARLLVENGYEMGLHSKSVTGSIFALKNFGWSDTPVTESKQTIVVNLGNPRAKD